MYVPPNAALDDQVCGGIRVLLQTLCTLSQNSPGMDCPQDVETEFAKDLYSVTVSNLLLSHLSHPLSAL